MPGSTYSRLFNNRGLVFYFDIGPSVLRNSTCNGMQCNARQGLWYAQYDLDPAESYALIVIYNSTQEPGRAPEQLQEVAVPMQTYQDSGTAHSICKACYLLSNDWKLSHVELWPCADLHSLQTCPL